MTFQLRDESQSFKVFRYFVSLIFFINVLLCTINVGSNMLWAVQQISQQSLQVQFLDCDRRMGLSRQQGKRRLCCFLCKLVGRGCSSQQLEYRQLLSIHQVQNHGLVQYRWAQLGTLVRQLLFCLLGLQHQRWNQLNTLRQLACQILLLILRHQW